MKRTLDDAFNSKDQLNEFKNTIKRSSGEILEKELGKIRSRALNKESVARYLKKQYEVDKTNGDILKAILDSVQHVSAAKLFEDIKTLSFELWDKLKSQENRRFYIVLTGGSVHKKNGTTCTQKSNLFLAILAFCYNGNLLDNFEDFLCRETPLHDDVLSEVVTNFVYLDDASFSGDQMSTSLTCIGGILSRRFPGKKFKMHLVVLYMSRKAFLNTPIYDFPGEVEWYNTETEPEELEEALLKARYQEHQEPQIDWDVVRGAAKAFTREYLYDGEMDKPLFYTDLKIPDKVSIYPNLLLDPVLVDSDFNTIRFDEPIVKNCELPVEGKQEEQERSTCDFFKIDQGTFCPVPTYKEPDWKDQVADMFPLF